MQTIRRSLLSAAAACAAAPLLGIRAADAAAPFLEAPTPAWYRFALGTFQCTVVSDGLLDAGPAAEAFVAPDLAMLRGLLRDAFLPTEHLWFPLNVLVVNTGRHLVLFEAGMGAQSQLFGAQTGRLTHNLRAAGIDPASIDIVALTHPHPDHCWGLVDRDDRPLFPNAQVAVSQGDWDFWTRESLLTSPMREFVRHTRSSLLPYRERMLMVRDGAEVVPGITAMATYGHTVGHTSYVIESGGQRLINMGDLLHHHVILTRRPDWRVAFDTDPEQGARTRRSFLDGVASRRDLVAGFHFPFPGLGHFARADDSFVWVPAPMLAI
jgi:glyoxylase-like metal-dependent hydrolase (beta-lactamase superfamily II)